MQLNILLEKVSDTWIRRNASPCPRAIAESAGLEPATIVTGASEGLGLELARLLWREGRHVVLIGRCPSKLCRAERTVRFERGVGKLLPLALDIGSADACQRISVFLRGNGLYADVLVNNAAIGQGGNFAETGVGELEAVLMTNVVAATRLMRHVLPGMKARARGGVLNIASLAGFMPGPTQSAYFASKAFLLSLSTSVAAEFAGSGVRICAVAYGPIETGLHRKMGTVGSLYHHILPSASAASAAAACWRSYCLGRRLAVPGMLNRLSACLLNALPVTASAAIVALLLKPGYVAPAPSRRGS